MLMAVLSVLLLSITASLLYVEHVTHEEFLLHVAAIPLEILVGAVLFENLLARRETRRKRAQLSQIKGFMFRFDMRQIFLLNLGSARVPRLSIDEIRTASVAQLTVMRDQVNFAEHIVMRSPALLDRVLEAYIDSESVFKYFLEWSVRNDFDLMFRNMIFVLNFIQHLKVLRSVTPGVTFAEQANSDSDLFEKIQKILKDNLLSFLDYAIELKSQRPADFQELMAEYQLTLRQDHIRNAFEGEPELKAEPALAGE